MDHAVRRFPTRPLTGVSEIEWKETREFIIEVKQGEAWQEVARRTTVGTDMQIPVAPTNAQHVRLNNLKPNSAVNINEFQVSPPAEK